MVVRNISEILVVSKVPRFQGSKVARLQEPDIKYRPREQSVAPGRVQGESWRRRLMVDVVHGSGLAGWDRFPAFDKAIRSKGRRARAR